MSNVSFQGVKNSQTIKLLHGALLQKHLCPAPDATESHYLFSFSVQRFIFMFGLKAEHIWLQLLGWTVTQILFSMESVYI